MHSETLSHDDRRDTAGPLRVPSPDSVMTETQMQTEEERAYYSLNRRVYTFFAPFYDAVTFPIRKLRREVADAIDLKPGARVIDIATGTGEQAFALAERAGEVVGIDLSEAMLRIARRKNRFGNVILQQADATNLPFDEKSFDASCVSFALHEMPTSIRERVIREMARVTRPGGSVTIVDYALPEGRVARSFVYHFVKLYERDHYANFVRSDWEHLLRSAGLEILEERPTLHGLAKVLTGRRPEALARTRQSAPQGQA